MKKTIVVLMVIIALLLCVLLAFLTPGCSKQQAAPEPPHTPEPTASQEAPAPEATEAPETEADVVDAVAEEMQEKTHAMFPVMAAAAQALHEEGNPYYDAANDEFFWKVLYTCCTAYSIDGMEEKDGKAEIPADTMRQLASACFAEYTALPKLPKMGGLTYDKERDVYTVDLSDSDTYCVLTETGAGTREDSYMVRLAYLQPGEDGSEDLIDTYTFELAPNAHLEEGAQFPLSVLSGYAACNVLARVTEVSGEGEDARVTIEHVSINWVEAEDAEAYTPEIVAVERPTEILRLKSPDAVDVVTASLLLDGKPGEFKDGAEGFAWFAKNYTRKLENETLIYQMRVYNETIYSMAPLYSFYFAG